MSGFRDYTDYDAIGLAELVRSGQVQASELVESCIARAEQLNPRVNAMVRDLYEAARAEARSAPRSGPFCGVPFFAKDLIQMIPGVPTEMGSRFWQGWIPRKPTHLYQRWLEAGLIVVAKTATPELGLLPVTEPEINGPTRNPWDLERSSGGSSGGSAAAVASGIVPMASAGDGGGSIRIPASCCGLFGFKPSRARNPAGPFASEHWSGFTVEHVLTRSVRDSAAMLDATHGPDVTAPYFAAPVEGTFLDATRHEPKPLRIAFHAEPATHHGSVHQDCLAAVEDAVRLCEALGHQVERVSPAHDQLAISRAFVSVLGANLAAEIRAGERVRRRTATHKDYELTTWLSHLIGKALSGEELMLALNTLQAESRRLAQLYEGFDLILTPTVSKPPIRIGELKPKGLDLRAQQLLAVSGWSWPSKLPQLIDRSAEPMFSFAGFTPVANFMGWPAMSVPLHWNDAGLPIGVMFMARPAKEALMFGLAAQLERARPWEGRRPPVFAD